MTTTKLNSMPYAKAIVIKDNVNELFSLISYTTKVAYVDTLGWLYVTGLYSMTTRKHLSAFAKEYCNTTYETIKKCYKYGLAYNIFTGDFINAETGEVVE